MKAIYVEKQGGPEVLVLRQVPKPIPKKNEALVRIHNAGLNFIDIYMREGNLAIPVPVPFIPGLEGAGVVESVGSDVSEVKPGDRVAYMGVLGSYAEYAAIPSSQLVPLPPEMSFTEGAALLLQGMTAHYLVHDICPIHKGDSVLVHAAAGGVGLLTVQWLKHIGATVIGTVSTEEKARIAKEGGADAIILYTQQDFVEEVKKITNGAGVDYIIDGVGKDTLTKGLTAVKKRGHICIFGLASGAPEPIDPHELQLKSISLTGGNLMNYITSREELLKRADAVIKGIKEGWLKLSINSSFTLDQAEEAHKLLENRQSTGKLVLKVCD